MRLSHLISKNSAASLSLLISSFASAQPNYHSECFEQLYSGESPKWLAMQMMPKSQRLAIEQCVSDLKSEYEYDKASKHYFSDKATDSLFRSTTQLNRLDNTYIDTSDLTKAETFSKIGSESSINKQEIQTLKGYNSLSEKKPNAN